MILVRKAIMEDLDWIISQMQDFSDFYETQIPIYPGDDYAKKLITDMIENHLFLMAHDSWKNLGFIAGLKIDHPLNPKIRLLSQVFWWVTPDYRCGPAAHLLLTRFTEWGRNNCDWIQFGVQMQTSVSVENMERHGYRQKERTFLLEVS